MNAHKSPQPTSVSPALVGTLITADASKISAADFHKLFKPHESELDKLCRELWAAAADGDTDKCRELRAEIKALKTELPQGWSRIAA